MGEFDVYNKQVKFISNFIIIYKERFTLVKKKLIKPKTRFSHLCRNKKH